MSKVFISYMREDSESVHRLARRLSKAGISIWLDRDDLTPGEFWKTSIRKAIAEGDYFLACFSSTYVDKHRSYMNEEINLAIDELRKRPFNRAWFIPILLENISLSEIDIGGARSLSDVNFSILYEDYENNLAKLISVLNPLYKTNELIRITHNTQYRFSKPVSVSPHIIRLKPAETCLTPINEYELLISPEPNKLTWITNAFGSPCALCEFDENLTTWRVDVTFVANIFEKYSSNEKGLRRQKNPPSNIMDYKVVTEEGPDFIVFADEIKIENKTGLEAVETISRSVDKIEIGFQTYNVRTSNQVVKEQVGGGMELATLLVQLLRYHGYPARFVSGYIVQLGSKSDRLPDLVTLSAWAECFIEDVGWVGLYPGESFTTESYIPVAYGLGHMDCKPIEGYTDRCDVHHEFSSTLIRI